jgi:cell division protein ZapA (FtsZ GTPase activity inhibitor)
MTAIEIIRGCFLPYPLYFWPQHFASEKTMSKTVSVRLGGKEMHLRCDDEARLRRAASEVDSIMTHLQSNMQDQTTSTLALLAALNIAEKSDEHRQQLTFDTQYVSSELHAMLSYLEQCLKNSPGSAAN